jgi:hypothetical protein
MPVPSTTIIRVLELTLTGIHARTIGERFFTAGTAIVLGTTLFTSGRAPFAQELLLAVGAESAVALLALVMKKAEKRPEPRHETFAPSAKSPD